MPMMSVIAAMRNPLCGMSFFAGYRRLPHGQAHAEMCTSDLGLQNLDAAAMRFDEFDHHRHPDSRPLHMSALRRLSLIKSLEYPTAFFGRDARSAVHDIQHQLFAFGA